MPPRYGPPGFGYAPYNTDGTFDLAYFGLRSDDPNVVNPRTGYITFPDVLPSGESLSDFFVRTYYEGGNPYYGAVGAGNNLLPFLQQSTDPRIQEILPQLQANQLSRTGDAFSFFGDNFLPALAILGGAVGASALTAPAAGAGAGGAAGAAGLSGAGAGIAATPTIGAAPTLAGIGGAGAAAAGGGAALAGGGGAAAGAGGFLGTGLTTGQALGLASTLGTGILGLAGGNGQGGAQDAANRATTLAETQARTQQDLISRILGAQEYYRAQTEPLRQGYLGSLGNFQQTGQLPTGLLAQYPSVPDATQAQRGILERQFRQAEQGLLDRAGGLGGALGAARTNLLGQRAQGITGLYSQQVQQQYQQDLARAQTEQQLRANLLSQIGGIATGEPAQQFGALGQAGQLTGNPAAGFANAGNLLNQLGIQNNQQQATLGQGLGASLALLGGILPNLFGGGGGAAAGQANPYATLGYPTDYVSLSSATPNTFGTY